MNVQNRWNFWSITIIEKNRQHFWYYDGRKKSLEYSGKGNLTSSMSLFLYMSYMYYRGNIQGSLDYRPQRSCRPRAVARKTPYISYRKRYLCGRFQAFLGSFGRIGANSRPFLPNTCSPIHAFQYMKCNSGITMHVYSGPNTYQTMINLFGQHFFVCFLQLICMFPTICTIQLDSISLYIQYL